MIYVLIGLLAIIALVLIAAAMKPNTVHYERSTVINAAPERILPHLFPLVGIHAPCNESAQWYGKQKYHRKVQRLPDLFGKSPVAFVIIGIGAAVAALP